MTVCCTVCVVCCGKDLEGKIPTDRISNEIVHQLRVKVSERLIRRFLSVMHRMLYALSLHVVQPIYQLPFRYNYWYVCIEIMVKIHSCRTLPFAILSQI